MHEHNIWLLVFQQRQAEQSWRSLKGISINMVVHYLTRGILQISAMNHDK